MTSTRLLLVWLALVAASVIGLAQEPDAFLYVDLRVSATGPTGDILVDRGASDLVQPGDLVLLHPRTGGTLNGRVVQVSERTATVRLQTQGVVIPLGTSGKVLIPKTRLPVAPPTKEAVPTGPEHPPWENQDEAWSEELPLLANVQAIRPEDRQPLVSGRVYAIGDQRFENFDGRSDFFYRLGGGLRYENPFGKGGAFQLDGEANYRMTDVPGQVDESEGRLRLDRLSYRWGGTRFEDSRHEGGRFLQYGMPEFGVLDGYEWNRRRKNGDTYGFSAGFLPELDSRMSTGDDFQLAAFYRWVFDPEERFSIATGFQKTVHNGAADRDLLVATTRYLPEEGWDFHGSAWIDFYTSGDDEKDFPVDLTQLRLSSGRQWDTGNGVIASFRHNRFPYLDRHEFLPVDADQYADDHYERLSLRGWRWASGTRRWYGEVGGWIDQDDVGGDAQIGTDIRDLFTDGGYGDVQLYVTRGAFTAVVGTRIGYALQTRNGRTALSYDLSGNRNDGFDDDADDFVQHRVRLTQDVYLRSDWNLSLYGESVDWDNDPSFSVGFYLERSF